MNVLREAKQNVPEELLKFGTTVKKKVRHEWGGDGEREKKVTSPHPSLHGVQESKLYGAHFRELSGDAPKAIKTTFADSDDE